MYPPMELLLRHAIQYFDIPKGAAATSKFDDDALLSELMEQLPENEQRLVVCIHLTALLLDGAFECVPPHNNVLPPFSTL